MDDLANYSKVISKGKTTKSVYDLVLEIYNVFNNDLVEDVYYIECEQKEIDNLVKEFLRIFNWDKHLCICSFIGKSVSIYTLAKLKECCNDCDFYRNLPSYIIDSKIRMYISYYKENKRNDLDVDYLANIVWS